MLTSFVFWWVTMWPPGSSTMRATGCNFLARFRACRTCATMSPLLKKHVQKHSKVLNFINKNEKLATTKLSRNSVRSQVLIFLWYTRPISTTCITKFTSSPEFTRHILDGMFNMMYLLDRKLTKSIDSSTYSILVETKYVKNMLKVINYYLPWITATPMPADRTLSSSWGAIWWVQQALNWPSSPCLACIPLDDKFFTYSCQQNQE